MKKLLYTLAAVLVCTGAAAQNPTLYFMEGVPLRSQMNPALAPQRGYFNIPVLGGLAVTAGGNTSLDHLLFRRDGRLVTLLSPSVSSADALSDLHSKNLVNVILFIFRLLYINKIIITTPCKRNRIETRSVF